MTAIAPEIEDTAVRELLDRILASPDFDASERNRHFLRHVVEETLAGRGDRIKAYSIATSVFGRGSDFDPQIDSIVRIEAGRLRRSLDRYYLTSGRAEKVRITIPRGTYVPVFDIPAGPGSMEAPVARAAEAGNASARRGCTILVKPFEQECDQSSYANLTRGLTRQVIVGLTRFTGLFVYGVETAFSRGSSAEETVEALPFDLLLTGGTTVTNNRFGLEVLLSDARTGRCIWGEFFDRRLDPGEIIGVRDEVANSVVRSLAQTYGVIFSEQARDVEGRPPVSLSSYESVILFYQYWRTYDPTLFGAVRDALERAIRIDPDYAEAFACLSLIYANWRRFDNNPPAAIRDPLERALRLAQRALELAPHSSRGYHALALACWLSGDTPAALTALQTGLSLNPNDTEIMADLGLRHSLLMNWDIAVPLLEQSYARNPAQPRTYAIGLALHHYMEGRYDKALAEMRRAKPEHVVYGFILMAAAAAQLGLQPESEAAVQSIISIAPDYGDRVTADLQSRSVHPQIIAAMVDGLRKAGLPGRETGHPAGLARAAGRCSRVPEST